MAFFSCLRSELLATILVPEGRRRNVHHAFSQLDPYDLERRGTVW
jgi:hypothetical protein